MSDNTSLNNNNITKSAVKSDFSSLVFSFDGFFYGIVEIKFDENNIDASKDKIAQFVLENRASSFDVNSIYIYRTNPSNPYFVIEKYKSKSLENSIYHIFFESLKALTTFEIYNHQKEKYLSIILKSIKNNNTFSMLLGFKDADIMNKLIRTLIFSHQEFNRTKGREYSGTILDQSRFIYSAIEASIRTEIYEIDKNGDNCTVPRENRVFKLPSTSFVCNADFVVKCVTSPIRFSIDIKAKMFSEHEKFWIKGRTENWHRFLICLKRDCDSDSLDMSLVSTVCIDKKSTTSISVSQCDLQSKFSSDGSQDDIPFSLICCDDSDIILSGTFSFDPDIPNNIIDEWNSVISSWKSTHNTPMNLQRLLEYGIPSILRKQIWPMLVGLFDEPIITNEKYLELLDIQSTYEKIITRDITRTFTCHEFFKETNGEGQKQLYRVCKVSLFELRSRNRILSRVIFYCRQFSAPCIYVYNFKFDELIAFSLLVQIMYKMEHRSLFGQSFDTLQGFLYIFKRLLYTHAPEIAKHFNDIGLEPQMFGPQWFLTLFTSKFPLGMVDLALDMYFSQIEFDGYKKDLMKTIDPYEIKKVIPLIVTQIENRMLIDCQMRLEQENAILAHDLIQAKILCNDQLFQLKEQNSILTKNVNDLTIENNQLNSIVIHLREEEEIVIISPLYLQLKQQLRKSLDENETSNDKKSCIINEYKKICSALGSREEDIKKDIDITIKNFKNIVRNCDNCTLKFEEKIVNKSEYKIASNNWSLSDDSLNKIRVEKLEMDLAVTKLKLAELEAKNEEMEKQLNVYQRQKNKK
ncbi:hypothetical protein HZS_4384, partial [Henneguya salminicola]